MNNTLILVVAAAILLLGSLALLWIGKRAARGTLERNHTVGIRTRQTLSSDEAWAAGHRAGARKSLAGAVGSIIGSSLAVLCGLLPSVGVMEEVALALIASLILASSAWVICWLIAASKEANRAAEAVSQRH